MRFAVAVSTAVIVAGSVCAGTASASTVGVEGGNVVFRSGHAASDLRIDFGEVNGSRGSFFTDALQPLTAGPGCSPFVLTTIQCEGEHVLVRLGNGDDRVDALRYRATGGVGVSAEGGDDDIRLNTLYSGGPVDGGAGNDTITVNTASPQVAGGSGGDRMYVIGTGSADVAGDRGGDLIDVQNTNAMVRGGAGDDALVVGGFGTADGNAGADTIIADGDYATDSGSGPDTVVVTGGRGGATVSAGRGDDVVDAFDARVATVDCGPGDDTVYAGPGVVLTNCEHVISGPMPANAHVDAVLAAADELARSSA